MTDPIRWQATVHYRTDAGLVDVTHDISEIHELQGLVEDGPHWDTVDHIKIVRSQIALPGLTVEQAEKL